MEDKLKNLKNILDETIFKDKERRFNEKHKKSVLQAIKNNTTRSRTKKVYNSIHLFASVVLTGVLLVGTYYIAGINDLFSNSEGRHASESTDGKDELVNKPENTPQNKDVNTVFQEENYDDMTKEEIYKKLLKADKFETVQGEYEIQTVLYDGTKMISDVKYSLSSSPIKGGHSTETYNQGDTVETIITYYKDDELWTLDSASKTYSERRYRNSSQPPIARDSLFPREITINYLKNLDNWEIEKQNEGILNHNTIVIKGILNDYAADKHSSRTFRFWVDKDTGILVKYETYNDKEEIVNFLNPKELQINVPIDTELFIPNTEGYQKS
ncbi:hypothetical protein [Bacillus sp. REN16]|uniref:hypothetical protein n=1 Tax=Bacillus sp. REN16 TaxID=2887296 RepID=UPI001E647234|nr:hypothetical protein [Bacillus sp. REN16]MCC3359684.1 hypothetical protein [Bacillus sp. REN16]